MGHHLHHPAGRGGGHICTCRKELAAAVKKSPGRAGAFKEISMMKTSRDQGALDPPILSQSTNQARRGSRPDSARPMISLQTSYRFDNCHCAGCAKDSYEQQVALHRCNATTKRSQRREHDQLPHPRVHLQDTFYFARILKAPRPAGRGSATGRDLSQRRQPQNGRHDHFTNAGACRPVRCPPIDTMFFCVLRD